MTGSGSGAGSVGAAAVGSSGSSGATGASGGADRVYRISLRIDDGSTQVITQETTPDFRSGDRVSLTAGLIQH
jgi:outer membrane lipoprotein SlyB